MTGSPEKRAAGGSADRKPLIGTPLMYLHGTSYSAYAPVADVDALLAATAARHHGTPVLYDACWDAGAWLAGSARPFEFALGIGNGTPSSPNAGRDANAGKSVLGRLAVTPWPGVRVGGYLPDGLAAGLPPGRRITDFHQRLVMADAGWLFDRFEWRAEGFLNRWETPNVGDLDVHGYHLEGRIGLAAGAFLAGRFEEMRFGDVTGPSGLAQTWDYDLRRSEAGIGYRPSREVVVKAVVQRNTYLSGPARGADHDLAAFQLAVTF